LLCYRKAKSSLWMTQYRNTTPYRPRHSYHELFLSIFGEHFFGIDGDEDAAAAGEDFIFVVEDFGGVDVSASALFYFAAFDAERFMKGNGLQIFDSHLSGEGDYVMQLVYFAHGVVEDA